MGAPRPAHAVTVCGHRHHCRKCGKLVCGQCAPANNTKPILELRMLEPVRHCKVRPEGKGRVGIKRQR